MVVFVADTTKGRVEFLIFVALKFVVRVRKSAFSAMLSLKGIVVYPTIDSLSHFRIKSPRV